MRLALTLFGIFWGTFAVVVLLAFGTGLERKAEEEMATGTGVVYLRSGWTSQEWRGLPKNRNVYLRSEDAALLRRELPGIAQLSEESYSSRTLSAGKNTAQSSVYGIEPAYATLQDLQVDDKSRFINALDVTERRRVAVLGTGLANQLFKNVDPIGQHFLLKGSVFTVVGVLRAREGSRGFFNDERVFIPATTHHVIEGNPYINSIVYTPKSPEVGAATLQHAFDLLAARHHFNPYDRRALSQWDASEFEAEIRFFLTAFKIFLSVVGGFTLLVGGIGVANIMFVVVRERRVEIGVKRAIGARRIHIMIQFMAEAALLVGLGALMGFLFAVMVIKITSMIPQLDEMGYPVISGGVATITAGVLALVALAAGVFPARHAAKLDPITCLRG